MIQLDLSNETAVMEAVVSNESMSNPNASKAGRSHILVDTVVHTASAIDSRVVTNLIKALGQRREATGEETYFIHVSLATMCCPRCR